MLEVKRTTVTLPLTLVLLASFLVGTQTFEVAYGNFVPTSPETIPPRISIISPINTIYENKVLLHLNITAVAYYQWVNHVSYTLDSQNHVAYTGKIMALNWSTILEGLSEGTHSLEVAVLRKLLCYPDNWSGSSLSHLWRKF